MFLDPNNNAYSLTCKLLPSNKPNHRQKILQSLHDFYEGYIHVLQSNKSDQYHHSICYK